jgi:hypothetical protein
VLLNGKTGFGKKHCIYLLQNGLRKIVGTGRDLSVFKLVITL